MEAHLCADDGDRWGLSPRPLREGNARDPIEMRAESEGGRVALGLPMGGRGGGERMLVGLDQGGSGAEDARNCLIAGRHGLRGKGIEGKRWGEGEARGGAVIAFQGVGHGLCTGFEALGPRCGSGARGALPRDDSTDNAQPRHSGKITHPMVAVELHLIQ